MSEEQNLLFEAAAPPPQRAKTSAKQAKTTSPARKGARGEKAQTATEGSAETAQAAGASERPTASPEAAAVDQGAVKQRTAERKPRKPRATAAAAAKDDVAASGEAGQTDHVSQANGTPRGERGSENTAADHAGENGRATHTRKQANSTDAAVAAPAPDSGDQRSGSTVQQSEGDGATGTRHRSGHSRGSHADGAQASSAQGNSAQGNGAQGNDTQRGDSQQNGAQSDGGGVSAQQGEDQSGRQRRQGGDGAQADGGGDGGQDAGMGGSSKSRRRRRKRKNRAAANAANVAMQGDGGQAGAVEAAGGESSAATTEAPMREFRQGHQPQQQGNGNGQGFTQNGGNGGGQSNNGQSNNAQSNNGQGFNANGQNSRRNKKKKFRRAGEGGEGSSQQSHGPRPPRPEPGNSLQGSTSGMGQRRNRKQQGSGGQSRGPRQFVGPMDHSYREVNGNFADVPASTIQVGNSRHRSNGHRHFNEDRLPPELMHNSRPVVIPDDAPTHIYFFIEDLFFTAKIQEAAKQQGVKVAFMKPDKDVVAHLSELHDHEHPSLIVFDLNNVAAKPLTLIPKLKAKLKKGTSILGFLSHLQGDLKQKAVEAGCHTVMPRSAFSQNLPNLLRRYGVEDEHEPNFNQ